MFSDFHVSGSDSLRITHETDPLPACALSRGVCTHIHAYIHNTHTYMHTCIGVFKDDLPLEGIVVYADESCFQGPFSLFPLLFNIHNNIIT